MVKALLLDELMQNSMVLLYSVWLLHFRSPTLLQHLRYHYFEYACEHLLEITAEHIRCVSKFHPGLLF